MTAAWKSSPRRFDRRRDPAAAARIAASRPPESVPAAAVPGIVSRPGARAPTVNPYAAGEGGLPDVFSSMFGAAPTRTRRRRNLRRSMRTRRPRQRLRRPAPAAASEPAPWLVEHAKRLTQQRDALMARAQATPAAPQASAPARRPPRARRRPTGRATSCARPNAGCRPPPPRPRHEHERGACREGGRAHAPVRRRGRRGGRRREVAHRADRQRYGDAGSANCAG